VRSEVTDILIFGIYGEALAWIAAEKRETVFSDVDAASSLLCRGRTPWN
jgi:hypothetical protein